MLYRAPDRIPLAPGGGRESTLKRWHAEGLPAELSGVSQVAAYAYRLAGGKEELPLEGEGFPVESRMIPEFEEKVIEKRERTQIVQDWKGNICEIGNEYSTRYLRNAIDFVTRRWIRCPVESESDWPDMARRYDARDPARLPAKAAEIGRRLKNRDWIVVISFNGPFWQLREWLGLENLCMMFHDNPRFVREMIRFWEEFVARLVERTFAHLIPDEVHLSEDMAYKSHPMISPAFVRDFLLPTYTRWGAMIRTAGCPLYGMDSDGYIGDLIPIWMEAGMNECDPIEVAAGNDLVAFHRRFGSSMAYRGGVDKRAIAKGGSAIRAEIARIRPVIRGGGYVPSCDHGIPSDVSWPAFVDYVGLLARETGWL